MAADQQSGGLERRLPRFPDGKGFLDKVVVARAHEAMERMGAPPDATVLLDHGSRSTSESLRAWRPELNPSSPSWCPLIGADGPLGLLTMCSRKANGFNQADRDLLSQIGTQTSLVLENALAYRRLRASRDDLEDSPLPRIGNRIGVQFET